MIPKVSKLPFPALAVLLLCLVSPLSAESYVLRLDPEESQATFVLGATGHDVHGTLHMKSGELRLDPTQGLASGKVVLDAVKTDTDNKRRDKKMHLEVLLSEKHPLIVFEAESLTGEVAADGSSDFEIVGTMTLVGKSHPMTLPIQLEVEGESLRGTSTFVVPFIDWGLHDPSILFLKVEKEVNVTIEAVGQWSVEPDASGAVSPDEAATDGAADPEGGSSEGG